MTTSYRPEYLWLLMGPVIGAFAGAVVATLTIWVMVLWDPASWSGIGGGLAAGFYLGLIGGGTVGGGVGFVAGVPLVFLLGQHLAPDVARRRAHVLGAVLPPIVLLLGPAAVLDVRLSWPHGDDYAVLVPLLGSALLGSRLAGWVAGKDASPAPGDPA